MLFLLKLTGRRIIFELHQVILDISQLEKHINIKNPIKQQFFDQCLRLFYVLLGLSTTAIIVFEQELKNRLKPMIAAQKINVLPLAVETKDLIPKNIAREHLNLNNNEFVLLVFGFINGYKGIEWIIPTLSSLDRNKFKLIIAGGENPYLKDKEFYQKFYNSIVEEVEKNPNVTLTGFIPENEIKYYFHAADLVLMPYTVFMSASGPFSLTLGYGKPILLSEKLIEYTQSTDFKAVLDQSGLTTNDLYFSLKDKQSVVNLINKYCTEPIALQKLANFSVQLSQLRDSKNILKEYITVLFPQTKPAFIKASRPSFLKIP
jgi:glycosyltransferase involved in cell wall biosynthesis